MSDSPRNQGFVLLLVLVVIMLTSMVAASLLFVLRAEHTAAEAGNKGAQAWSAIMSGVYQAMHAVAQAAPGSLDWRENPILFCDQLVTDDGVQKWFFSVYSGPGSESADLRYGLTDEAGKINLYRATAPMLEALPNLTPTLAQDLLSAVAANPDPPLTELDELLYVNGFSSRLLYGGIPDPTEPLNPDAADPAATAPVGDPNRLNDAGLCPFLTVSSYDLNQDNEGKPRLNLNQAEADWSSLSLSTNTLAYLAARRQSGPPLAHPSELLEASFAVTNAQGAAVPLKVELGAGQLAQLLDRCTATDSVQLTGLINLNTAPKTVLAALPGMNEALAESVVAAREGLSLEARQTPAWLFAEGLVNADGFKKIAPYLTTRSFQYRFRVAAYAVPAGTYRVVEVVIDAAVNPPSVSALRDLTRLGLPKNLRPSSEPTRLAMADLNRLRKGGP